jgi:hypothetical protein
MFSVTNKKYEVFNNSLVNYNFLIDRFIFESEAVKNSMFVNDKRNFPFYYFLGKNSLEITEVAQIGLCGGYNLGMYLTGNKNIKNVYIYDNNNNNKLLRLTRNNLLKFNFAQKHYSIVHDDFLNSIKENKVKLLFVNDKDYIDKNINEILSLFVDFNELQNLIFDNIIDLDKDFEKHVNNYCDLRNIKFEKYNKRNEAIILRKN